MAKDSFEKQITKSLEILTDTVMKLIDKFDTRYLDHENRITRSEDSVSQNRSMIEGMLQQQTGLMNKMDELIKVSMRPEEQKKMEMDIGDIKKSQDTLKSDHDKAIGGAKVVAIIVSVFGTFTIAGIILLNRYQTNEIVTAAIDSSPTIKQLQSDNAKLWKFVVPETNN